MSLDEFERGQARLIELARVWTCESEVERV